MQDLKIKIKKENWLQKIMISRLICHVTVKH